MAIKEVLELIIKGDAKGAIDAFKGAGSAVDGAEKSVGRAGQMFEKVTAKFPGLGKAAEKFGIDAGTAGTVAAGAATAAAGATAAFAAKSIAAYQSLAGEVLNFQRISGATAEQSSAFVEVAGDYGVSADQAAASVGKFAKTIGATPAVLEKYGVQIAKNKDGTTDLTGTLENAAGVFASTTDATKRAELGAALFGKSWQDMVPLLEKGASGLQDAFNGVASTKILNQEDLRQAEEFRLAMDDLKDAGEGLMIQVGKGLVPVISDLAKELGKVTSQADKLTKPIGGLGSVFGALVKSAKDGSFATGGFTAAMDGASKKAAVAKEAHDKLAWSQSEAGKQATAYGESLNATYLALVAANLAAEDATPVQDDYNAALKLSAELAKDAARNEDDLADSIDGVWKATQASLDPTFRYHESLRKVADDADDVAQKNAAAAEATKKHGAASSEAAKANRELQGAQEKLAQDIQVASLALLEQNGTVAGSKAAYDTQIAAIRELRATYGSELGPVGAMIDDLELKLRRAAQQAANLASSARIISGGGAGYVGTGGGAMAGGPRMEGGGGATNSAGMNVTLNVQMLDPSPQNAAKLVDMLVMHERNNGNGWRQR